MKKLGWLSGIGLLLMPALAAAQTSAVQKILDVLNTQVGFLFYNFNLGDRMYLFYIKFCLWIIIFSILFYAGGFVFRDSGRRQRNRGIRVTLAIVIALISAIAIPDEMVRPIVESYGIVAIALLVGMPLFGIVYFNHVVLPRQGGAFHGFRAAIYYILALLITNIVEGVRSAELFAWVDDLYFWGSLARDICLILMIFYLIAAIASAFRRDDAQPDAAGGETIWDRLRGTAPRRAADGQPYPADLRGEITNLRNDITAVQAYLNGSLAPSSTGLMNWRQTLAPAPPALSGAPGAGIYTLPPGAAGSCWTFPMGAFNPMAELAAWQGHWAHLQTLLANANNLLRQIATDPNVARLNNADSRALATEGARLATIAGQIRVHRNQFHHDMRI
ncbi:hypothetical protein JW968_00590 [Candidatus Woesearchaeota archaeon]|nr:hypothetical protein [Candidatus Woesearchaeota archaeon]